MKDRVIRMMIGARDEAAGMVGGRGEKEGGLWNIVEQGIGCLSHGIEELRCGGGTHI
jgi:hypothetical protein